jgi:glycogen operon protein
MLLAGDEIGRSQGGNNNAYCQDNAISWLDWDLADAQRSLLGFTQQLLALRRAHPVFRRRNFFQGRPLHGSQVRDIVWLNADGSEMTDEAWNNGHARALGVFLSGEGLDDVDPRGQRVVDDSFVLLFNADAGEVSFSIAPGLVSSHGDVVIDTAQADGVAASAGGDKLDPAQPRVLQGRSLVLVRFARKVTE